MRGGRTESAFAASVWETAQAPGLEAVGLDTFYRHMSDLGLFYGEEFRPIRELSAGAGRSAGRGLLSDAIAHRAGEYPLHPVLFDGALQIFSAGAATIEGRTAGLRLPVRFARILFLRSPGASIFVRAGVKQANDEFVEGGIYIYDEAGRPCVRIDGFRAISVEGARRSGRTGQGRDLIYHVAWERTSAAAKPAHQAPVPLGRLHDVVQHALDEVLDMRGRDHLQAASAAGDELTAAQVARGLGEMGAGLSPDGMFTADSLGVAESMPPVFAQVMGILREHHLLIQEGDGYRQTPAFMIAADSTPELFRSGISRYPGHLPEAL